MLWHHCLKSADGRRDICSAGGVASCLYCLDSKECTPTERTCAIGLLHALCKEVKQLEYFLPGVIGSDGFVFLQESNRETISVWRSPI